MTVQLAGEIDRVATRSSRARDSGTTGLKITHGGDICEGVTPPRREVLKIFTLTRTIV
jgi:hypothetical protein